MPDNWEIRQGDALALLRTRPEASVHCCVTSPPYWSLRDYGVPGQLGLEETPDEYAARMVEVFREVRRVLRDDGTLWLNMGDAYSGLWSGHSVRPDGGSQRRRTAPGIQSLSDGRYPARTPNVPGLKPKDLIGIPWLLAFALRADGWFLRADIVWAKLAPMPESVRDRPTRSHEFVFLLAKSQRYYYDADAIREPASYLGPNGAQLSPYGQDFTRRTPEEETKRRRRAKGNAKTFRGGGAYTSGQAFDNSADIARNSHGNAPNDSMTRNKRDVWLLGPQPFPGAHFATFPEKLVEPCILAGCPEGGLCLDPFSGSGTAGVVALRHRRRFLGLELNPAYCEMARRRIGDVTRQASLLEVAP
jgi:DNA modification methylase